ncbi:hypothetical protein VPH35_105245 [Triticum aestivum]
MMGRRPWWWYCVAHGQSPQLGAARWPCPCGRRGHQGVAFGGGECWLGWKPDLSSDGPAAALDPFLKASSRLSLSVVLLQGKLRLSDRAVAAHWCRNLPEGTALEPSVRHIWPHLFAVRCSRWRTPGCSCSARGGVAMLSAYISCHGCVCVLW